LQFVSEIKKASWKDVDFSEKNEMMVIKIVEKRKRNEEKNY